MKFLALLCGGVWFWLATTMTPLLAEEPLAAYDGRILAPAPAEALAGRFQEVVNRNKSGVVLQLTPHVEPSTQAPLTRAAWVCLLNGKPLWMVTGKTLAGKVEPGALTAKALRRARQFVAYEREARRFWEGKDIPGNWQPHEKTFAPEYQQREYGLQISRIELVDRDKESWQVTMTPVKEGLGGEIWLRFQKGLRVSAEYGR